MKLKKLLVFGMATVIAFSGAKSFSASAAGNYHDIYFRLSYSGDGGEVATRRAQKADSTKTDFYNKYSKYGSYVRTVVNDKILSSYRYCAAGDEVFIRSGGKSGDYVYVAISPETHSRTVMEGFWSPDSIKFTRTK